MRVGMDSDFVLVVGTSRDGDRKAYSEEGSDDVAVRFSSIGWSISADKAKFKVWWHTRRE